MACELCEHCQSPLSRDDKITIREGFSYHKRCHKCYVCSETNLLNAEVFKGVIFCSSCAQRIFQGCSTARRTKTMNTGRGRRNRSKSHRRDRERVKVHEKKVNRSRDGVIELARLVGSNTDSDEQQQKTQKKPSKIPMSDHALQVETNNRVETVDNLKRDSPEMGTTTDVTQDLLKKINSIVPEMCEEKTKIRPCTPPVAPQHRRHYRKKDVRREPPRSKPSCSDLRIAELGMSTEIANMALRKNSEMPVTIRSDTRFKGNTSYTLSVVKLKSDKSGEGSDWEDSAYSTIEESETSMMDRRLGSILKMPLKLFKKNILDRSSLVSILMSAEDGRSKNLFRKIKQMLHEEVVEHQIRGIKRLYSTINRRNRPYKLGWVGSVKKISRDSKFCSCSYGNRCRHFRKSHSYRCMRAQVMKLAGPTNSELAVYRNKIKRFIAPQFLINMLTYNKNLTAIKLSAACQKSCSKKA